MSERFLQTKFWAEFKGRHGWVPHYFEDAESNIKLTILTRHFSLAFLKFDIAYIPMAPEFSGDILDIGACKEYLKRISTISKKVSDSLPKDTICIRFDFPIDFLSREAADSFGRNLVKPVKKAPVDIQPPDTVILDISKSEEELLASMKSKWRYNIRLAEKKGVTVKAFRSGDAGFEEAFENFYDLFQQTSERDKVSFHNKDYYKDLLDHGNKGSDTEPLITLYLASHEGQPLAGIITLFCPREAVYLYGASGNIKRNYMPAYLLQWTAIRDAKKYKCQVYDFYGCPPTEDANHPMHGLFLFKTGFGGSLIHRPGSFDISTKKLYNLYLFAEKFRAWWHKFFLKKIAGR